MENINKSGEESVKDTRLIECGNLIAVVRARQSVTQDELAASVSRSHESRKINRNTISRIENGTYDSHLSTFFGIAEALHVSPNEISPAALLAGTPLERYGELTVKNHRTLKRMIDIIIEAQNDTSK